MCRPLFKVVLKQKRLLVLGGKFLREDIVPIHDRRLEQRPPFRRRPRLLLSSFKALSLLLFFFRRHRQILERRIVEVSQDHLRYSWEAGVPLFLFLLPRLLVLYNPRHSNVTTLRFHFEKILSVLQVDAFFWCYVVVMGESRKPKPQNAGHSGAELHRAQSASSRANTLHQNHCFTPPDSLSSKHDQNLPPQVT